MFSIYSVVNCVMTGISGQKTALVLDSDMASALTIVRSLKRKGIVVDLAGADAQVASRYSRAIDEFLLYPDPLMDADPFLQWLQQRLLAKSYDLVIPVTERTLVPISEQRERFVAWNIAMADDDSLAAVLDKNLTIELAERLNLPVPSSDQVGSIEQLQDLVAKKQEDIRYPIVVKPARSVGKSTGGRTPA